MSVRIGIVAYGSCKDTGRVVVAREYIEAVERTGAQVLIAPPGVGAVKLLDVVHGLVLVGGGDIDPALYGAERHHHCYGIDAERDATESAVIRAALERRMKILAICRGMQLLNVVCGGTLHQHIPDVVGEDIAHRTVKAADLCSVIHPVRLDPASTLATLCGETVLPVASTHHQAVNTLGRGVRACAWANDGIVEAIAIDHHPEVIAVQWHPELTASADKKQQALFDWLAWD